MQEVCATFLEMIIIPSTTVRKKPQTADGVTWHERNRLIRHLSNFSQWFPSAGTKIANVRTVQIFIFLDFIALT